MCGEWDKLLTLPPFSTPSLPNTLCLALMLENLIHCLSLPLSLGCEELSSGLLMRERERELKKACYPESIFGHKTTSTW